MPTFVIRARDTMFAAKDNRMAIQAAPIVVGEKVTYTVDWSERGTPSAADAEVYFLGNDEELTGIITTAAAVSGNTATVTITPAAGHGGREYRLLAIATIGGQDNKQPIHILVEAAEGA